MGTRYESLKRLIGFWETYEEETDQAEFGEFAEWLANHLKHHPELNHVTTKKRAKSDYPDSLLLLKNLDEPLRFLEYTSRISRLHEFYVKKFFNDIIINNRLEFLFLYTVSQKGSAKKTELINAHLVDYTTGMDIIKRLVNSGLLEETLDGSDKRAKQLVITSAGNKVLEQANKKMLDEIQMFLACINMNKWKKALPLFEEINTFHTDIYQSHNDKNPAELLNLMDSLKHLYK